MLQDMRLGFRRALRTPGFSIAVTLILAIGVGAATAMASVLYALAWRPIEVPDPGSLMAVSSVDERALPRTTPLPALDQLRRANVGTAHWCAYNSFIEATESGGRSLETYGDLLAGDCSTVIGITPSRGRWFTDAEAPLTGSGSPVAVITDRYWKRMFDATPDVVGRSIRIRDTSVTVIGVMPPEYDGFSNDLSPDVLLPFNVHRPSSGGFMFIGRLSALDSIDRVNAAVRALWPSVLESVLPASQSRALMLANWSGKAELIPGGISTLRRLYAEPVRRLSLLTLALLALVCINVGGLMVARVASRLQEMSAMRAIGASTSRIVAPVAAECSTLAIGGTILAIPLAYIAAEGFGRLFPTGNLPWTMRTTPEPIVLLAVAFGLPLVIATIVAAPAWVAARRLPQLRADRGTSRSTSRIARAMLVSQIAMTVALVFTSALVVRSFYGLQNVDRGFKQGRLLSLRLSANPGGYNGLDAAAYYRALVERVATVPGVESVGLGRYFGTINAQMPESPIGYVGSADSPVTGASEFISPGFFSTLGVPLLSGRDIAWTDLPSTPVVALVSDSLARMLSPDGDVVGRVIRFGSTPKYAQVRIVGVAGNISIGNVRKTRERILYLSSVQSGETAFASVHVRTAGPPMQFARAATAAVESMGREHVMGAFPEMLFGNSMVAERMGTAVSGVVAVLALIISCIGVFALLLHSVERRTREIGIRVAVGASRQAVSRLVMGHAMRLLAFGLAIGVPAALASTSLIRSLLFEVTESDALTLSASIAALAVTALLGALAPTLRALRIDPATALRSE